jgi:hypothetical protein
MLDIWGQINEEMDSLAKTYWNKTYELVQPFYTQSTYGWSLWIGQRKLSSWDRKTLYGHAKSTGILDHWSKRRNIPQAKIRSIDWEAGKEAIKNWD